MTTPVPSTPAAAQQRAGHPMADRIAAYTHALKFEELPTAVVHEVKRRVIDSIGCALGSWSAEPCVIARKVASDLTAKQGATLWGTEHRAPLDWAAFANGLLVRYLDYNDTYLSKEPAHPSDNIPAAIAVAEAFGANGRELITAIALAYEIQCRFCDAVSLRARGWDHVTYGCFSTTAAASRLMKLDAGRTRHALGIAGVTSAALRQSRVGELSHWKGAAFANAARHGVYAAMLASNGMTGPAPIFEGEKGFEKLVAGAPMEVAGPFALPAAGKNESPHVPADGFMILKTLIKYWPAEYHAQSAVEVAMKLRPQIANIADVEAVIIESHDAAVDIIGSEAEKWRPTHRETADHSLPYMVGAALVDGELTHRQFTHERLSDPKLLAFLQRVEVRRSPELTALYPDAVANKLTIKLKGGRAISERVDYPKGHAKNALADSEVESKFHLQADDVLGRQRADAVLQWAWQLEKTANPAELPKLLKM